MSWGLAALAVAAGGYAALCAASPTRICRRCRGRGEHPALIGWRIKTCTRCNGIGKRLRPGVRGRG